MAQVVVHCVLWVTDESLMPLSRRLLSFEQGFEFLEGMQLQLSAPRRCGGLSISAACRGGG